ncbi:MAG: futalosine hydrolase [Saprospiraceae bacterium]
MNILLCAATEMEFGNPITSSSHKLDCFVTGVGLVQTAWRLSQKLHSYTPELCIQIGIAGSFDPAITPGMVTLVQQDCFADLGAQDRDGSFLHLTEILPCDNENPFERFYLRPEIPFIAINLPMVNAISVNTVHGHQPEIDQARSKFDAQIESMEGASFFAVCISKNVPCLQIRSISNMVEPRNKSFWQINLAIQNLHKELAAIIEVL